MHLAPFFRRSIFDDDMDDFMWLDRPFWENPFNRSSRRRSPRSSRRNYSFRPALTEGGAAVQNDWIATVRLNGYKPEEVKIERSEDNSTVKVHARQGSGDDFSEFKKTIHVPDNVDRDHVDVDLNSSNGILMVRAPYKKTNRRELMLQEQQEEEPFGRIWPFHSLTDEMRRIHDNMLQLTAQSFPGSVFPTFVKDNDGVTRLNMDFDLRGYKPEEINVTQENDKSVTVEARHEKQHKDGSSTFKHFKQTFSLPNNVKINELQSKLMQDGRLRLDAPCEFTEEPKQEEAMDAITEGGVEIPVKRGK